jgi:tRNA (mo5U34)-methyltransferase
MIAKADLEREILALAPWHLEVQVTPEVSTRIGARTQRTPQHAGERPIEIINVGPRWKQLLSAIYPDGLDGRSVLDVGCNCGAYIFWARELGAGECLGIEARDHWLRQARFLAEHGPWMSDGIRFERMDLYEYPDQGLGNYDITFFLGIFYHLPDPLLGLKIAADATHELIILDTATRTGLPDGAMVLTREGKKQEQVLSGIHGLSWRPTGPRVLEDIFDWLGFGTMRVVNNRPSPERREEGRGRMRVVAARDEATVAAYDDAVESRRFVPG